MIKHTYNYIAIKQHIKGSFNLPHQLSDTLAIFSDPIKAEEHILKRIKDTIPSFMPHINWNIVACEIDNPAIVFSIADYKCLLTKQLTYPDHPSIILKLHEDKYSIIKKEFK